MYGAGRPRPSGHTFRGAHRLSTLNSVERGKTPVGTTVAAGVLMLAVSAPFVVQGVSAALRARSPGAVDAARETLVQLSVPAMRNEASQMFGLFAVIFLVVSGLALLLAVGVLARRGWARETALATFGLFALVALASGLRGISADPPGRNAGWAIVVGLVDVAITVLLMLPATARDFQLAEFRRERRRARAG